MPRRNDITPILPPNPLEEEVSREQRVRHRNVSRPPAGSGKGTKAASSGSKLVSKSDSILNYINLPLLAACLAGVLIICIIFLAMVVNTHMSGLRTARDESAALEEIRESYMVELYERYGTHSPDFSFEPGPFQSPFDVEMRRINPDFVCWITVDGTNINYPVVRTTDNETYLHLSFFGEQTQFGVPFMDYRNVGDFVPHIIIYGHNTRHNNLFTDLHNFLDPDFFERYRTISLKVNGRVVEYKIFSARLTDINDPAYFLNFSYPGSFEAFLERNGAPADAVQILTLSTCVRGPNDDDRLIVQGFLTQ